MYSIFNNVLFKNFISLTLNQGLNIIVTLILTPILFQRLGESQYGLVNLSLSIVLFLGIIVNYGFNLNGPKRIAVFKTDLEKNIFTSNVILLRLLLALFLSFLIFISFHIFGLFENYWLILFPTLIILFSEALYPLFYLQGKDKLNMLMILNAISKIVYAVLIVLLIKNPEDGYLVNFFFGISSILVYLMFWFYLIKKENYNWLNFSLSRLINSLHKNLNLFISSIGSQIIVGSGIIILSNFITDSELGEFSLAHRVGLLLRMIPVFFIQSILQKASREHANNKESLNYLIKPYLTGLIVSLFVGLIFIFLSKWVIYILAGKFIPFSEHILLILSFIPFFSMLNFKNLIIILVKEKSVILNKAIWVSAFFTIVFSVTGSMFFGSFGLAYALIISEIICFLAHGYFLKKEASDNKMISL
jgi:O-antigen/teichoic acid export membrane protein